ncbi:MAG: hypothetical protein IH892_02890, partial [Planctomycetes bacterium]|nr:hypothetical protein [Planctomycetota bacterium]
MKKRLPLILLGVILLWTLSALRPTRDKADALKVHAFGRLPVVLNGRVQPIDSVARNALIIISGKQSLTLEGNGGNKKYWGDLLEISQRADAAPLKLRDWWQFGKHPQKMTAVEWLMEAAMTPDVADRRYIFRIHHPEVIRDMELETGGVEKSGMHWYSYNELEPKFSLISEQVERIRGIDAKLRSPYERQMTQVFSSLGLYRRIKNSFRPEESHNFPAEIQAYEQNLRPGIAAIRNQMAGRPFDEKAVEAIRGSLQQYEQLRQLAYPLIIPPSPNSADREAWSNIGTSLYNAAFSNDVPPEVTAYANLVSAYRRSDSGTFNHIVEGFRVHLEHSFPAEVKKGSREHFFNSYAPFRKSIVLYLFAFVLACCSWLNMSDNLRKSAFYLIILSFVIHTSGLIFRMVLEGRPPVTNLYSSAVFIGWGAVLLGLCVAAKMTCAPLVVVWIALMRPPWRRVGWIAVCLALAMLPWCGKTYLATGNPVFPFASSLFPSYDWGAANEAILRAELAEAHGVMDRIKALPATWFVMMRDNYPVVLLLVPGLLLLGRHRCAALACVLAQLVTLAGRESHTVSRYVLPSMWFLALLAANESERLRGWFRPAVAALLAGICLARIGIWSSRHPPDWREVLAPREEFLLKRLTTYEEIIRILARVQPARLLISGKGVGYRLPGRVLYGGWLGETPLIWKLAKEADSVERLSVKFKQLGTTHMIHNYGSKHTHWLEGHYGAFPWDRRMLELYATYGKRHYVILSRTESVDRNGGFYLYQIRQRPVAREPKTIWFLP